MSAVTTGHEHIKVWLRGSGVALERCEDAGCLVDGDGHAECGRLACPACGCSGANLSAPQERDLLDGETVACSCGHAWAPAR